MITFHSFFLLLFISLECDSGWTAFNDHCYQRQTEKLSYNEARAHCNNKVAILAVPNTQAENEFLAGTMNPIAELYTWIGFDYDNSELWEDGSSSTASNSWRVLYEVYDNGNRDKGQPAVFIRPGGDWSFDPKSEEFQFICEKGEPPGVSIIVWKNTIILLLNL